MVKKSTLSKLLVKERCGLFEKYAVPMLHNQGFVSYYDKKNMGHDSSGNYLYLLVRFKDEFLECVTCHVIRGDRFLQIRLNIYKPNFNKEHFDLEKLSSALLFHPQIMRLRSRIDLHLREKKWNSIILNQKYYISYHYFEWCARNDLERVGKLLIQDMENIDAFRDRWLLINKPIVLDLKLGGLSDTSVPGSSD